MSITEIKSPRYGLIGYLHEVECVENDSILIFQLPRSTEQLSRGYMEQAQSAISQMLPPGRSSLVVGADINVYELAGADAIILKLKGLI